MNNYDPNSNLAKKLREAGIDPEALASMSPEEKAAEANKGITGLDPNDEQNKADAGEVSELQKRNIESLREQATSLTPLSARIARQKSQHPLGEESPASRS